MGEDFGRNYITFNRNYITFQYHFIYKIKEQSTVSISEISESETAYDKPFYHSEPITDNDFNFMESMRLHIQQYYQPCGQELLAGR